MLFSLRTCSKYPNATRVAADDSGDYFGVLGREHWIVHTHNECHPDEKLAYHEESPFMVLLRLYLKVIQQYPYCYKDDDVGHDDGSQLQ